MDKFSSPYSAPDSNYKPSGSPGHVCLNISFPPIYADYGSMVNVNLRKHPSKLTVVSFVYLIDFDRLIQCGASGSKNTFLAFNFVNQNTYLVRQNTDPLHSGCML